MNTRGIRNSKQKRLRYYKFSIYSLFTAPLIFVLVLLPVAPVFANEAESLAEVSAPSTEPTTLDTVPNDEVVVEEDTTVEETSSTNDSTDVVEETLETQEILDTAVIENDEEDTPSIEEVDLETDISSNSQDTSMEQNKQSEQSFDVEDTDKSTSTNLETDEEQATADTDTTTPTSTIGETASTTEPSSAEVTDETTLDEPLPEEPVDVPPQTDEVVEENPDENIGEILEETLDTEVTDEVIQPTIVFNDENKYQFSKDQCISMGDGSFYCMDVDTSEKSLVADGVYAALDENGDKEIFMKTGGDSIQITHNTIDDDAPYYDEISNTIVWHSLVDGRYQINEFNLKTQESTQLTNERYNNMYPSRDGDVIVWQGWVGNDWEIMLEEDGELTMITDNTEHDISPRINANHIIWQSFEDGLWRVKIYDVNTGTIETISDSDGGSVENPRFVLVYDTKFDNGDVETKGYDLKSGESVPLSSTPAPLPASLPDPEPTDEERALVAPPVQIKTKSQYDTDILDGPDSDIDQDSSQATSTDDVVVSPYIDEVATSTESAPEIETLIVTPYVEDIVEEGAAPSSTGEIVDDLVVTPLIDEIEDDLVPEELS